VPKLADARFLFFFFWSFLFADSVWGLDRHLARVRPRSGVFFFGSVFSFLVLVVHGQVLAQWPQMFHILNMFGTSYPRIFRANV
jgi:hypothetical protein